MAEIAVSLVLREVFLLLKEEAILLSRFHKEFEDIKDELESIQAFLKDADRKAAAEGDTSNGIKTWVKQVREVAFRIEDLIDEYMILLAKRSVHPGCTFSPYKIAYLIKTLKSHHQRASKIQDIKFSVQVIKERRERYGFHSYELGSSSSTGNQNVKWHDPRMASLFIEEAEVVGFEAPRDELIGWLVEGATERTVICVVGMGGLGKTTLAKKVFDNQKVTGHFDCRACITVSQSYTIEGLLKDMMKQFSKATREPLPQDIYIMDEKSLITEVRYYLQQKRYVIFFDDVWKVDFWDEIELAIPDNKKGSRIIITTRTFGVADFCKKSSLVYVHKLQPLPPKNAWELFCMKSFLFEFNRNCPAELKDISTEIVQKCEGLPLAIVAIGGLLSTKAKTMHEWKNLSQNLSHELESNPHLTSLKRILSLSYDDLPYYLKSCFLHFGIYPEDYSISCVRLSRQWTAEGFVKHEKGKTSEEVAEQYLTELIHRSLVQVSEVNYDGKARSCRVHDLLREMIIRKMENLSFCYNMEENDQPVSDAMIRRLAIRTNSNDLLWSIRDLHIRSMYTFRAEELPQSFVSRFYAEFRLLRVLDFEDAPLNYVPDNIGNLFHLRYLSLRNTKVKGLPKSIGNLQNLETLDLKQTLVHKIPREVNKLRKLRHLIVLHRNYSSGSGMTWEWEIGVRMKYGIGCLTSLQKLYHVEADHGGLELIKELQKLRQLRKLGLKHLKREYGKALCDSIDEMKHLETLDLTGIDEDEIIDLHFISSPPQLKRLHLQGRLDKLPDWIPKLQYLVRLWMYSTKLTDDPLKSLLNLPNLLDLSISDIAYEGETLQFQGGFHKLKILRLRNLNKLNFILIDEGTLPVLEYFQIGSIPKLKEVPHGIHHLKSLEVLDIYDMPHEFKQSIDPDEGQEHWVIKHVPIVYINHKVGSRIGAYDTHIIRHSRHS